MNEDVFQKLHSPLVIGSGLTGAAIAMMKPDVQLYDKARKSGGRVSTKDIEEGQVRFDIGATMFRDKMEVHWLGKVSNYDLFEIWKTNGVEIETKPIYDEHHFYPILGMESIANAMLKGLPIHQSMTLKSIRENPNKEWICEFYNNLEKKSESITNSQVILTLPLPQIFEIFSNSEENPKFNRWFQFLKPYNDYRKTLISLFSWNDWTPNLKSLGIKVEKGIPINTSLQKGENWEYESWEHIKYPNPSRKGSHLLVQFSALFSETHFEHWMDSEKKPTPEYKEMFIAGVKERWNAPAPDAIWNHRWKYAQAQMPLLGREGALILDSEEFLEWKQLCKETGIMVLGDWLFGSKMERIIGGVHFLIHNEIL